MLSAYPACFIKEDNGYSVIFPDLGIATCGDDLEDSLCMAIDCLAGYLYSEDLDKNTVPPASALKDIDPQKVMDDLEVYSDETFVNLIAVDVAEYAKLHFTTSVRLTIPSWLNDAAMKQHINLSQVLQEALMQKIQAK